MIGHQSGIKILNLIFKHQFFINIKFNMFTILNFIIIINTSFLKAALTTEVDVLLSPQIENARCSARCLDVVSSDELKLCLDICHLEQAEHGTDICNLPHFCTGPCQAACDHSHHDLLAPVISSYTVSRCGVSWEVEKMGQNVVFVVAGLDQGGMWHLVFDSLLMNNLTMSSNGGTKYSKLEIIAVGEGHDVDKIEIIMIEEYGLNCDDKKPLAVNEKKSSILIIASFIVLSLTASLVLMSSYLYRRTKNIIQSNTLLNV